mmetsp:Transcript_5008/g.7595  ORF Transcript_5008/g.7595 Transcript_5008/m.7595 type:complete len:782 (+) Transcript_5008:124-2469(+)
MKSLRRRQGGGAYERSLPTDLSRDESADFTKSKQLKFYTLSMQTKSSIRRIVRLVLVVVLIVIFSRRTNWGLSDNKKDTSLRKNGQTEKKAKKLHKPHIKPVLNHLKHGNKILSRNNDNDNNKDSTSHDSLGGPVSYNVCNGLSNQFLSHAGHISQAIVSGEDILIPDVFITNGIQNSTEDVLPTRENSVPLQKIIDMNALLEMVSSHGITAQILPYDDVVSGKVDDEFMSCSWLEDLKASDHQIAQQVLHVFKPSPRLNTIIEESLSNLFHHTKSTGATLSDGICLHHRDGLDWHEHCKRWEGINDGRWRKNCLNDRRLPLHKLVKNRIPEKSNKSWIYYVGDSEPSKEMVKKFKEEGIDLFHREKDNLLHPQDIGKIVDLSHVTLETHRDLYTAVDFFTCSEIESFIGNSVSTFSANQIAKRNGMKSSWYNSRSIPLAQVFHVFHIPFVYTYTEESKPMSKALLKASILSVRGTFGPHVDINILYHGKKDRDFLKWLKHNDVIIHKHEPTWLDDIERMRQHGNLKLSHLFADKGSYIGTWQRLDIPLFIDAEYCLFLDSDTVLHDKFGLHDFGLDITPGLAVSSEGDEYKKKPWNLGVVLFNVPKLRETYARFLQFVHSHADNPVFKRRNISDQGAYLEFYKPSLRFLHQTFNVKPYWQEEMYFKKAKVTHFHGLKPQDILKVWMGYPKKALPEAVWFLIPKVTNKSTEDNVCQAMYDFSQYITKDEENLHEYCNTIFKKDGEKQTKACLQFFTDLAAVKEEKEDFTSCRASILKPLLS